MITKNNINIKVKFLKNVKTKKYTRPFKYGLKSSNMLNCGEITKKKCNVLMNYYTRYIHGCMRASLCCSN